MAASKVEKIIREALKQGVVVEMQRTYVPNIVTVTFRNPERTRQYSAKIDISARDILSENDYHEMEARILMETLQRFYMVPFENFM